MKILFFDTETTWIIKEWIPLEAQPCIIQIWAIIWEYNEDWDLIGNERHIDLLFNPWVKIPPFLTELHWISDEIVKGKPTVTIFLSEFIKITKEVDYICGHNVSFDMKMINVEVDRVYNDERYSVMKNAWRESIQKKIVCTMKSSIEFCGLRWKYWSKFPKLNELYRKLFNEDFNNAHNAAADIEATRRCFFELKKKWIISL